jgi:Small-conductance mechanosensitive channel
MSPVFVITVLLWLSVAGLAFALLKRAAYWREGRATAAGAYGWTNLLSIPKRYFVDLHHVVARDPYIAKTHVATAGGAILAMALVFVNYGLAIYSPWLDKLIFLAALVMLVGAVFVWRRRHGAKAVPSRLSRGPWDHLPLLLGSFALGLVLFVALPAGAMSGALAIIVALLIAAGAFAMTFGAARGGPMKHALAGLLHLAFHPRQERFAERNDTDVVPPTALKAPLLDAKEYGVGKPVEFRWNQLLSFDACVQCGKVRSGLSRVRRRSAAQSEEADSGSGHRNGGRHGRAIRGQSHAGHSGRQACRRARQAAHLDDDRSGHAVVLHDLPRLRAGVPDADRTCRRDCGYAPQSDAGGRQRAGQRPDHARQSARDGQLERL